jgi:3-oxoadipate enol-lactonase
MVDDADGRALLVLLCSLGTSTRIWDGVRAALSEMEGDLDVLAIDLPGHGEGPVASATFTIADLARDVVNAVERRRPTGSVVVAGVSMGGAVALEVADRRPAWLSAIAMFNSAASFGGPGALDGLMSQVRVGGTDALREPSAAGWFTAEFAESNAGLVESFLDDLSAVDDGSYLACCGALAQYDASSRLSGVNSPALIVAGDHDRGPTPQSMQELARALPNARYAELAPAAHLAVVEQPRAAAALISELVRSVSSKENHGQY